MASNLEALLARIRTEAERRGDDSLWQLPAATAQPCYDDPQVQTSNPSQPFTLQPGEGGPHHRAPRSAGGKMEEHTTNGTNSTAGTYTNSVMGQGMDTGQGQGPLGALLKPEVRDKIWKRDYVDFLTLLPLERVNIDKFEKHKEHRKEEDEDRRCFRLISRTFGNWLQAFSILASIVGEKRPEHCSALFCYLDNIWEAHWVYGGHDWLLQRMQIRQNLNWNYRDIGLWMRLRNNKEYQGYSAQGTAGQQSFPGSSSGQPSSPARAHKRGAPVCWPKVWQVYYTSFDEAMQLARKAGKVVLMAMMDVESAFRLLPVHPELLHQLSCHIDGHYYVDRSLTMGCSISYYEAFSTFLEWVVRSKAGVVSAIHYLDDFLCVGPPQSNLCAVLLQILQYVTVQFGVPLAQ
ncbi:hypothetical protein XELAEV_18035008mg [Xenopus laevis]|uniref:Reverse transcriptase domain-containing protein n=1 Tax=Xenopus laevis TaxID=8355 RepID=A0A974CF35_XENLA|nr:hypothetical protein XELAEV_18035008mg [Xenopus laevis]